MVTFRGDTNRTSALPYVTNSIEHLGRKLHEFAVLTPVLPQVPIGVSLRVERQLNAAVVTGIRLADRQLALIEV